MALTVTAPGRIVLFGEHQDYLGLPVIPAAIDLYIKVSGQEAQGSSISILLDDLGYVESFTPTMDPPLTKRSYLQSSVRVLQREGIIPQKIGVNAQIQSEIPIQAGLSSSSALVVVWLKFLSELYGHSLAPMELTKFAYQAEVVEFNEPGGMQDHMAIAHGYVNYEEFNPVRCTKLLESFPSLLIGDSQEKKDTLNTLAMIKQGVNNALFELGSCSIKDIDESKFNPEAINDKYARSCITAAVENYTITKTAYYEFKTRKDNFDQQLIGDLIDTHHVSLRDQLHISTPKIEKMIKSAKDVGALGCKITGSGNGGCMIAFCPGKEEEVKRAIQLSGGVVYSAQVVSGARIL
ncbi:MAG: mevalonate kinase family protein [Candidatus Hodarchaeales archaeon]|jgi:galactokinase